MESSGKCRKKVVESFEFCFVDFLFVSHFPTDQTKALEKLLKDHAGKYATGDEVSMGVLPAAICDSENVNQADLFLAPQILAGIERFNVDMSLWMYFSTGLLNYFLTSDKVLKESQSLRWKVLSGELVNFTG
ncbi:hypothetical protein ES332_D03G062100v1 [Gossypium tomentosum]|uniref:Uncharacterized protein n=1 Tax=Gossypium tomentosum TaxID=34277 RepID=A0A5D2LJZ5_GOSTO|nr:hypothetical protein ES332_D03G062100v1 [Gossypium tomentosum]